jgi:hypothetical protein
VGLEDDALFILSSYFLGIEHPPGYPLFTLIAHLFTLVPLGSVAYRVHLASAFFGALTCAAVWLCARTLAGGRLPAYVAALGLGLSPVFWSQAIIAEVYTLNTFLFVVLVYLGLQACPPGGAPARGGPYLVPWMALLFGLALSNHWPLMLLVAPAFAVLLWPRRSEILARLPHLILLVLVGLLPYAWLVYRSWMALPISFYGQLDGPLDSALDCHRVRARRHGLDAFPEDRLGQNRRRGGPVAGDIAGLGRNFLDHLGAHVLDRILELDLLGHRDAVLRNQRRTELLVEHGIPALGAERHLDRVGQGVHAAQNRLA